MMFVENNYWELLIAGLLSWTFVAEILGARQISHAPIVVSDDKRNSSPAHKSDHRCC